MHNSKRQSFYGHLRFRGGTTTYGTRHNGSQFTGHLYGAGPYSKDPFGVGKEKDHVQQPEVGTDESITISLSLDQYAQVQKIFHKSITLAPSTNMVGNLCTLVDDKDIDDWIVDIGLLITWYVTLAYYFDITGCKGISEVHLSDGSKFPILYVCSCRSDKERSGICCVPNFKLNLLLVAKLTRELNCVMKFYHDFFLLQDRHTRQVKRIGKMIDDLYHLKSRGRIQHSGAAFNTFISNDIWHRRLGHVPYKVLAQMQLAKQAKSGFCPVCPIAKQTRLSFPHNTSRTNKIFYLVHGDVWGPYKVPTYDDHRFLLTLVDDHTRMVWIFLLKFKSDVPIVLKEFLQLVKN